jgi:hypothetical protein
MKIRRKWPSQYWLPLLAYTYHQLLSIKKALKTGIQLIFNHLGQQ